jgi:hypothetical protein
MNRKAIKGIVWWAMLAISLSFGFAASGGEPPNPPPLAVVDAWRAMAAQPSQTQTPPGGAQAAAEAAVPEGYIDNTCPDPARLTETVFVGAASISSPRDTSLVWDGSAYAAAWMGEPATGNTEIYFARVAADGTLLIPAVRVTNATSTSGHPSLAWTGSGYGLVWSDNRDGNQEIYFTRISASGSKVGSDVRITNATGESLSPRLVWSGTEYGIAWVDSRDGNYEIYFAVIDTFGNVHNARRITNDANLSAEVSLAWTGSEYGMAWEDSRTTTYDIYFARIDSLGYKIGIDIQITTDAGSSRNPSLCWTGGGYGVAWMDTRATGWDIYFAPLAPSGDKIDERQMTSLHLAGPPVLAWTGAELGLAWPDARNGGIYAIYFAPISIWGVFLQGSIRAAEATVDFTNVSLAYGTLGYGAFFSIYDLASCGFVSLGCHADTTAPSCPTGLAVTGNSGYGITLTWAHGGADTETAIAYHRIYRDGSAIGITVDSTYTDSPRPSGSPSYTVVAVNANGWESEGCDVVVAPELEGGCVSAWTEDTLLSVSDTIGDYPSAAWDGSAYGVAWQDNRDGNYEIYFARVSPDGTVIVPATRVTNQASSSYRPTIAWTGSEYGIAWYDYRTTTTDIYFTRVGKDGAKLLADSPITSNAGGSYSPSLVWADVEYGVAWYDYRDGNNEIYFARISVAGLKVGIDVRVTSDTASSIDPSLTWTGQMYGLAWEDTRTTTSDIYFANISATGTIGPAAQITTDAAASHYPRLAWNGNEYGVAWQDTRTNPYSLYFARIYESGSKIGEDIQIRNSTGLSCRPSLVWTGAEYTVAWEENSYGNNDIFCVSLDSVGDRIGVERRMTARTSEERNPTLAVGGRGLGLFWRTAGVGYEIHFLGLGCGAADTTPPSCPASPCETARTETSVTLSWGPSVDSGSDIGHYHIYRDGGALGTTVDQTWTDDDFDPAAGYVYVITATNAAGYESGGCASVDTSDGTPPTCPGALAATNISSVSVTLSWLASQDAGSGLMQYEVYRNGLSLNHVAAGTTTYTDATVYEGMTYSYTVLAEDYAGNLSEGCTPVSVTAGDPGSGCGDDWTGIAVVSATGASATGTTVAWDGAAYGVSWVDNRSGGYEVYFARISSDGTVLVPAVQVTNAINNRWSTCIVSTGTGYGLVWEDWRSGNYDIYFIPISKDGVLGTELLVATGSGDSRYPSIVWTGVEYGVAWRDSATTTLDIYFQRISAAGALIGTATQVTSDAGSSGYPSLASANNQYGVAWEDDRDGDINVFFARLDSAGALIAGSEIRVTADDAYSSRYPSLAWNGTEYGVAYQDNRTPTVNLYFSRISAAGAKVGGDVRVTTEATSSTDPTLVWTGSEYGVVWADVRAGNSHIYYATLDPEGSKLGADRALTFGATTDNLPSQAVGGHGLGVVYRLDGTTDDIRFMGLGCGSLDTSPPPCPASPAEIARTSTTLTLGWGPSQETESDFGHYAIYRDGSLVGATLNTTWTDSSFDPAAGPVYIVSATNAAGFASPGCDSVDTADHVQPSCVGGLMASVSGGTVTLHWVQAWDDKSGVKEYRVYRNGSLRATIAVGTNTFSEAVAPSTTYNYVVETADYAGNTNSGCTSCSVWVYGGALMLFLTKNADTVNADLDWNDVGITDYVVYRSMSPQVGQELKRVPVDQTQDTVLNDGIPLWFYYIQQRE